MYNKSCPKLDGFFFGVLMNEFENKVLQGLLSCGVKSNSKIGVAVSGGADSISLLTAIYEIVKSCENKTKSSDNSYSSFNLYPEINVITVNHNIRPQEESGGDAAFVKKYCSDLNSIQLSGDNPESHYKNSLRAINVNCSIVELEKGLVEKTCTERGQGIEEAARYLRYKVFEQFIKEKKLDYLCLAHNQNDQVETVLMRFLSGGSMEALAGIKMVRGLYIRPMLDISRTEIEAYLCEKKLPWRNDSTNADTAYFRNKIRLKLVPFLDEFFGNWKPAVLSGAKRAQADSECMAAFVDSVLLRKDESGVWIDAGNKEESGSFVAMEKAVKERVLLKACSLAGEEMRVPVVFIDEFLRQYVSGKNVNLSFHNIEIYSKNNSILVRKSVKTHTQMVFSAIIEDIGTYEFPFGEFSISELGSVFINGQFYAKGIELPCCIRSAQLDDEVRTSEGKMKKISDIYSDWHVPVELRCSIPVLQNLNGKKQEIVCIFGGIYGFNNWVVK